MKDNMTWKQWERQLFDANNKQESDLDSLRVALIADMTREQYADMRQASKGPPPPKNPKT